MLVDLNHQMVMMALAMVIVVMMVMEMEMMVTVAAVRNFKQAPRSMWSISTSKRCHVNYVSLVTLTTLIEQLSIFLVFYLF